SVFGESPGDFGKTLSNALTDAGKAEKAADDAANRFAAGDPQMGIHEVMIAAEKANISVRYAVTLKNKLLEAYRELMNTPLSPMDDLKKALLQARDLWRKLKPAQRLGLIAALVATVGTVAFVSLRGSSESYSLLYAGLAPEEAGRIVEQLKADKVVYRLTNAGTGIEVPQAKSHQARL